MRNKLTLAALVLLMSGCALIKQGTTQFVQIETRPPGATFELDGVKHTTPFAGEIPKGERALTFKAKGYKDETVVLKTRTSDYFYWGLILGVISATVDWISGAWQEFDVDNEEGKFKPIVLVRSDEDIVLFSSEPANAFIKIDDVQQQVKAGPGPKGGKAAARVLVKWDPKNRRDKKVQLIFEGHEEHQGVLKWGETSFHGELIPLPQRPNVVFESDPPGAEVYIDGVRVSTQTTPLTVIQEWRRGFTTPRKVEFRKAGYKPDARHSLKSEKDVKVVGKLDLIVQTIPLKIECWPLGTTIEVDGRPVAASHSVVPLVWSAETRSHKLRFSRPGYLPEEVVIEEAHNETPVTRRLKPSLPRHP